MTKRNETEMPKSHSSLWWAGAALLMSSLAAGCTASEENDPDAGGADAGGPDAGVTDASGADASGADAGGADASGADAGGADAGGADASGADAGADLVAPTVISHSPIDGALGVRADQSLSATFSEAMAPATLTGTSFTVAGPGATSVPGSVACSGARATFRPLAELTLDTRYQASITTEVHDLAGNALAHDVVWSFTTSAVASRGPSPVLLGLAGDYVILAKSGIDTVPTSAVTGDIGVSPIDSTAITGFSLTLDASNQFATSDQVNGQARASDYAVPSPSNLTTAVSAMETAYTDAAGRAIPDFTELGAGEIGGLTLAPGLYKWGTNLSISTDVTLDGGPNDVWILQIAGDVTQASGTRVNLSGGALPQNIFWQTFGQAMVGTTAHFEGIVLCQTAIVLETGASVNGRLLAQTAVTLDQNTVTQPAE